MVNTWGQCSAPCGGGIVTRHVECMSSAGELVDAGKCAGIRPAAEQPCNTAVCAFCEGERCSGHGACVAGACECEGGYHGVFCANPPDCRGVVDTRGVCCEGVLDVHERCCVGATPSLDAQGECCPSGSLDIVGTCDGAVALVDITGALCSTILDAQVRLVCLYV
jgi:hypothetical protein